MTPPPPPQRDGPDYIDIDELKERIANLETYAHALTDIQAMQTRWLTGLTAAVAGVILGLLL